MLSSISSLPTTFRLLNKAEKLIRFIRPTIDTFEETVMQQTAMARTGLSDFGDPDYQEGLRHLLASIPIDTDLHFVGRIALHDLIVSSLANRLRLVNARKQQPALFEKPLRPPLIVIGLPRSGTTFLHRMLALDPASRGIPLWELRRPIADQPGDAAQRQRKVKREINIRIKMSTDLDSKHYIRANTPEECMWALSLTFVTPMFWVIAPVYSYMDWYMQQPRQRKYQEYRQLLHIFQATDPSRRLALKAPAHTGALAELATHVPEAHIIQTHRDPIAVTNSISSLFYSSHSTVTKSQDVPRMAEKNIQWLETELQRNLAARQQHAHKVYDVHYQHLVADPIGTIQRIYAHYNLPWTEAYAAILRQYIQNNPKGKHGVHRYQSADFGLTDEAIQQRFATYQSYVDALTASAPTSRT